MRGGLSGRTTVKAELKLIDELLAAGLLVPSGDNVVIFVRVDAFAPVLLMDSSATLDSVSSNRGGVNHVKLAGGMKIGVAHEVFDVWLLSKGANGRESEWNG